MYFIYFHGNMCYPHSGYVDFLLIPISAINVIVVPFRGISVGFHSDRERHSYGISNLHFTYLNECVWEGAARLDAYRYVFVFVLRSLLLRGAQEMPRVCDFPLSRSRPRTRFGRSGLYSVSFRFAAARQQNRVMFTIRTRWHPYIHTEAELLIFPTAHFCCAIFRVGIFFRTVFRGAQSFGRT